MPKERRSFTGAEKLAILREHLIEKVPISEVCEKHGLQPTVFYGWQKKLFEEGAVVFEQPRAKSGRQEAAEQRRIAATVRTTGFVEYERIRYSMPPTTIGIPGTLFLYPDRVRIVTRDGTEVEHPRRPAVGNTSYRSEDRVAKLAAVHGQRAKLYQKRQEILELGPPAERLLTEWVHHPRMNWKSQVEQLHELLLAHGPQRTLGAIERVLLNGHHHVKAIRWVLDREGE